MGFDAMDYPNLLNSVTLKRVGEGLVVEHLAIDTF